MLWMTLAALSLALVMAGLVLHGLFREHVTRQFDAQLRVQLDQLTASFELNDRGQPVLRGGLADPRWQQPYSGLYWQIDSSILPGQLRSRSLWDFALALPVDRLGDGEVHRHLLSGPNGQSLRVLERQVHWDERELAGDTPRWRLIIAQDRRELEQEQQDFGAVLALCLCVLGLALLAAAWFQVTLGLAPLRGLQAELQALRNGKQTRLVNGYPQELWPLLDDFNGVLEQNAQVVNRARQLSGNLAHAIKTPLAVISNAALDARLERDELATLVQEQVKSAQDQVDWHLSRARVAASGVPGLRTPVLPALEGLVRVMRKVYADRALQITVQSKDPLPVFAGESQDFQELLGNVLDNACKWARNRVEVNVLTLNGQFLISVDDDGPGLDAAQRKQVFGRGIRADERAPGSGLGLAIVREITDLYGGTVHLDDAPLGGLRLELTLPCA